jgi:HlyD family secretion protein
MKGPVKILVAVIALALASTAWWVLRNAGGDADPLYASGTVEATEADLGFQLPGRVAEVVPREGDAVSAGQILARLDAAELDAARGFAVAQVAAAEARLRELEGGARGGEVAQARAALRSAEQRAVDARREAERARRLHEGGAVSRQALDRAETALEVAEAARDQASESLALVIEGPRAEIIQAQRAMVEQARAGLARADANLANAVIAAPFSGLVTVRHRQPGETVSPGAPILTLMDPDDRWVRIYVAEDVIGRVSLGQSATIRSDTYPDRAYPGEVVFIGSEAEFTPRNVQTPEERTQLVYPVKVRITGDPDFQLKPGIPADVDLREGGAA